MKFLDHVRIHVKAGDGGNGCLSFRREKFVEFGGPDGGDGGRGGHVYVEATDALNTLVDYRYRPHVKGGRGSHGKGKQMTGAAGRDITLEVPVGTQIYDADEAFLIADLDRPGERILLARGGAGGFGNARFKSSTEQAPRRTTPGEPGEEMWVTLRLKLLADAGLVGLPNAGKSTFLAAVSRAKPKIADYPFTTLVPQLGVVRVGERELVLADIPGLIEGAHAGHGLGDRFLGHVERCSVLLHLVDGTGEDVAAAYRAVRAEIESYGADLAKKPELVALSKADAILETRIEALRTRLESEIGGPVFVVSAVAGRGVRPLLSALLKQVEATRDTRRNAQAGTGDAPSWSPLERR